MVTCSIPIYEVKQTKPLRKRQEDKTMAEDIPSPHRRVITGQEENYWPHVPAPSLWDASPPQGQEVGQRTPARMSKP